MEQFRSLPEPEWLYIRSMAVSPKAQGLGISHRLLDAVEEYAIENGFDRLFLYTTRFFDRCDRALCEARFFEGPRDDSGRMVRNSGFGDGKEIRKEY